MPNPSSQKPEKTILITQGGLEVEWLNYGATLKSIRVPVGGEMINVLLKYSTDTGQAIGLNGQAEPLECA
jgi:hypothetical protein